MGRKGETAKLGERALDSRVDSILTLSARVGSSREKLSISNTRLLDYVTLTSNSDTFRGLSFQAMRVISKVNND